MISENITLCHVLVTFLLLCWLGMTLHHNLGTLSVRCVETSLVGVC